MKIKKKFTVFSGYSLIVQTPKGQSEAARCRWGQSFPPTPTQLANTNSAIEKQESNLVITYYSHRPTILNSVRDKIFPAALSILSHQILFGKWNLTNSVSIQCSVVLLYPNEYCIKFHSFSIYLQN